MVQRVATNDNEWYNEWQRVAISANSSLFRIREESTTKHQGEIFKPYRGPWREKRYWIKSRRKPLRKDIISKKQELQKQLFADFLENWCFAIFAIFTEKNPLLKSLLIRLQVFRPASATLLKRDSCEYCGIFKNSFFYRTLLVAASAIDTFF